MLVLRATLPKLHLVFRRTNEILWNTGIRIYRFHVGEYSASLEMAGYSLTFIYRTETCSG